MIHDVVVLSSRREYFFPQDSIRLSALNADPVRGTVQLAFGFHRIDEGGHIQVFEPAITSFPPSLLFLMGHFQSEDGAVIPVRGIGFEARHVTLDVVGGPRELDAVFSHLTTVLKSLQLGDGLPILREPVQNREYSELTFRTKHSLPLVSPAVSDLLSQHLSVQGRQWVPSWQWQAVEPDRALPGDQSLPPGLRFTLARRMGSTLAENHYYSVAPLAADQHVQFLSELCVRLNPG